MTAMKQQKSNDGIRGLFFLEPCYTLWPVGIDKSWPIHTSSNFAMLSIISQLPIAEVWGSTYLFWKVKSASAYCMGPQFICMLTGHNI
jgi:hypothetical protein